MFIVRRMTHMRRCLRKVEQAAAAADPALAERIREALDELEAAYLRPSERIVALEALLHGFEHSHLAENAWLGRLLRVAIDRRQGDLARSAAPRVAPQALRPTASLQANPL
ncbi:hypothetical protein SAMN04488125_102311 [Methylorubrum salsuginis]|uniref:Uncharacterized protein n=2 Tax=Methylorubrum salsuginis TaxID=414703 RepID=A0A1I4AB65_9HYPH|nr:hypothetical protein SAMN04488125_102311 [Methylorubrum salsuginis]